jgi:hypothetical protein
MKAGDVIQFSTKALTGYTVRTLLMILAMAIGVASVILLTALGEGARVFVTRQFSSLGTYILIVLPGRSETTGGPPPLLGETPRELTLEDALFLARNSVIRRVAPITVGSAPVSWKHRDREVTILGSTETLFDIRQLSMAQGMFLPAGDPTRGSAVCVLGYKLKKELFGNQSPLGEWVRIGDRRFRIIGVLAKKGQSLGMDMGDVAIVPVASAQALFNTSGLFRVLVQANGRNDIECRRHRRHQPFSCRHPDHERDAYRRFTANHGNRTSQGYRRSGRPNPWAFSGRIRYSLSHWCSFRNYSGVFRDLGTLSFVSRISDHGSGMGIGNCGLCCAFDGFDIRSAARKTGGETRSGAGFVSQISESCRGIHNR